jgi:cyclic pyranopterin phosphate synthase
MPLGDIAGERFDQYLPLTQLRAALERRFTLGPSLYTTGGPRALFQRSRNWRSARLHHAAHA